MDANPVSRSRGVGSNGSHGRRPESNRRIDDRRKATLSSLIHGNWLARRRLARRTHDRRRGYYVDRYEPAFLCLIVAILLLSCADALLTLSLLELGGRELNAFMALLIDVDAQTFAGWKMALTGSGVLFLAVHHRFRLFRFLYVYRVLQALLLAYLLLIGYELVLLDPARAPRIALFIALSGIVLAILSLVSELKRSRTMPS